MADTTTNCGGKLCIKCKARMEGCQMMDVAFDIETSTAIKSFVEIGTTSVQDSDSSGEDRQAQQL
eukprot:706778-Heterocapsa_arctica.AAC.1